MRLYILYIYLHLLVINLHLLWKIDAFNCNKLGCTRTTTIKPEDNQNNCPVSNLETDTEEKTMSNQMYKSPDILSDETPGEKETEDKIVTKNETKKGLLARLTMGLNLKKGDHPKVNDKTQETLLQRYYAFLIGRYKRKGSEKDINPKVFKGGTKEQTDKEQKETDSFYAHFKNYFGKVCFENIGCFSATEYADISNRPVIMLPMSPDAIGLVFHMYTIESRSVPYNFSYNATEEQLRNSTFKPKLRTAVIVHGYQSGYAVWMENLKDFILYQSNDSFNVIVVVWEKGSKVSMYNLAATNTRVVGACIGYFIEKLCKTFKLKNDMFYLFGHSLGAHTVGYAAKRLKNPKVARIVALDPAGVGFHFSNPAMRLDSTDATIVSAIHTDGAFTFSEGFGTQDTLGHFDFYPNGGTWQPGCPQSMSVTQKLVSISNGKDITCSHSRACLLINNLDKPEDDCSAVGYQCFSYEMFLEGRCADCRLNKCQLMGININHWLTQKPTNQTLNKKYYINTSHKEDYCLEHYQFAFHLTNDSDSCSGILYFNLKIQLTTESKEIEFRRTMSRTAQKKIHTLLVNFEYKIEKVYGLTLSWKRFSRTDPLRQENRGFSLKIPYIEINFMSSINDSIREQHSTVLCASNPRLIANKGQTEYQECSSTVLPDRALTADSYKLVALEFAEDIHSVDSLRAHRVFHKIKSTKIKEKYDNYQTY